MNHDPRDPALAAPHAEPENPDTDPKTGGGDKQNGELGDDTPPRPPQKD